MFTTVVELPEYRIFMLTLFAKNKKENLNKRERNELARLIQVLVEAYQKGEEL